MPALIRPTRRPVAFLGLALAATLAGCSLDGGSTLPPFTDPATQVYAPETQVNIAAMTRVSDQLYTQDLVVGTGRPVAVGDSISVFYTGRLSSGFQFESRAAPSAPVSFVLDAPLIQGWIGGLPNARVGGTRRLVIGPALGYGYNRQVDQQGRVVIPSNSVMVFDIEIVAATPRP